MIENSLKKKTYSYDTTAVYATQTLSEGILLALTTFQPVPPSNAPDIDPVGVV